MKTKKMKRMDAELLRAAQGAVRDLQAERSSAEAMLLDQRMNDDKNLQGWLRLGDFLVDAEKDEAVISSPGALDFLHMMSRLTMITCLDLLTGNDEAEASFSKIKAFKALAADLAGEQLRDNAGRAKGGETMKKRKEAHTKLITDDVEAILKNPQRSGMTDPEIARWLMDPPREHHKFNGRELTEKTMTDRVKEIRAAYKASI